MDAVSTGSKGSTTISLVGRPYNGRPYSVSVCIIETSEPTRINSTGTLLSWRSQAFCNVPSMAGSSSTR